MEKIMDVVWILSSMPYDFWLAVLLMWCGIYIVFIAPTLFRFWIIPKIENRYRATLEFDNPVYNSIPMASWGMPPLEVSLYIFCKHIGWEIPLTRNSHTALKKISYDVSTADKSEIVMSLVTMFFIFCGVASMIIVAMTIK